MKIKPVYYLGEERLVSLDVLKLYRGEDVIRQNPEDIDPDQWLDEGELTKADNGSYLEIPIIPEEPDTIAMRGGIHEIIQAEIQHEDKEAEAMVKEMLDAPPVWNEVPDLMMETKDCRMIRDIIDYYSIIVEINLRFKVELIKFRSILIITRTTMCFGTLRLLVVTTLYVHLLQYGIHWTNLSRQIYVVENKRNIFSINFKPETRQI